MRAFGAFLLTFTFLALPAAALEIVNPLVARFDGGPNVPVNYAFRDNETIFFRFDVAGLKAEGDEDKRVQFSWQITAVDGNGVPLAKPESTVVKAGLAEEDKNWKPRVRVEIPLPNALLTGSGQIQVSAKDEIGGTSASLQIPFRIRGLDTQPGGELRALRFRFLRSEESAEPLTVAAYSAGDTVWARFEIAGFAIGKDNAYDVAYGLDVFRANGQTLFKQDEAARDAGRSDYPRHYTTGALSLKLTRDLDRGEYTIVLRVHDRLADKRAESKHIFRVE